MIENSLQTYFALENNSDLFTDAIKPPSCGGSESFKYLALIGDKILDLSLIDILTQGKATDSGDLTIEMKRFHNENTLFDVALFLELEKLMKPTNNQMITKNDLKESFEALLGACYKIHGFERPRSIVFNLLDEIDSNELTLDINYIGQLQEYAQQNKFDDPEYSYSDNYGSDHQPIFYCTLKFLDYEITSDPKSRKDKAKKNSAYKMLLKLSLIDENGSHTFGENQTETVSMNVKQSIDERTLVFEKADISEEESTINLKSKTGEKLVDWAERKARKNPFGMLVLLSARIKEFSGSSWLADVETYSLAILNLKYKEEQYFAIGQGASRTKARRDAALKIIKEIHLFTLLEEQFSDFTI